MSEPDGAATDPKPGSDCCRPLTASRLAALCAAGLAGGVVGGAGLGLVGMQIGAALTRGKLTEPVLMYTWLFGTVGAVLGLPLGIAAGLRAAGRKLGIRGRFWPAVGATGVGALVGVAALSPAYRYSPWAAPLPFVFALGGGIAGYLLSRSKCPADSASDS